jgi:hypothetical protein
MIYRGGMNPRVSEQHIWGVQLHSSDLKYLVRYYLELYFFGLPLLNFHVPDKNKLTFLYRSL